MFVISKQAENGAFELLFIFHVLIVFQLFYCYGNKLTVSLS